MTMEEDEAVGSRPHSRSSSPQEDPSFSQHVGSEGNRASIAGSEAGRNSEEEAEQEEDDDDEGEEEEEEEEEEDHDDKEGIEGEESGPEPDPHRRRRRRRRRQTMSSPQRLFMRFTSEPVKLRVHDVKIEGNVRTKDSVIEAELETVKIAENSQDLLREVALAISRLQGLGIFEECVISLEPGPVELPGTANVLVNVKEPEKSYSGDVGVYSKPETTSWTFDGSIKWKNLLGDAETWDSTLSYGYDGATEMSAGLLYPRFKGIPAALVTRASVFNQDWLKYSSYTEQIMGVSAGIVSDTRHDLSYNLMWRILKDPSHMASPSVRRQLGHGLLSSLKYTFKIDERDSTFRPTKGYAIRSSSQIAGIGFQSNLIRFFRQEVDLRGAIPLGFANAALNLGLSGGLIIPWGEDFCTRPTPISDRFFVGGNASLACEMNGPVMMPGFRGRGVGPMDIRRSINSFRNGDEEETSDALGGDLSVTGFADLSFDLPFKILRNQNIHAHCFICAGNLVGLPEINFPSISLKRFWSSTRLSAGAGIVIPTKLFRLEVNYCEILRQCESDHGKTGFQLNFTSPR